MTKKKIGAYCDEMLWKQFLQKVIDRKGKVAVSECLEEAIRKWLE